MPSRTSFVNDFDDVHAGSVDITSISATTPPPDQAAPLNLPTQHNAMSSVPATAQRPSKPPPAGPAPPAPGSVPPNPPATNGYKSYANGTHVKGKKKADLPVDPQAMYESLKSKIAALEEELIHADEEEERFGKMPCINELCH